MPSFASSAQNEKIGLSKWIFYVKNHPNAARISKTIIHLAGSFAKSCYSYGLDRKWNKLADMSTARSYSSSVPIPGGIWVTGGYDGRKILKTTEMVFLNKTKQSGTIHKSRPCGFGQSLGRPIVQSISPLFWLTKKKIFQSQEIFGQALIFLVNQISFWYTKISF